MLKSEKTFLKLATNRVNKSNEITEKEIETAFVKYAESKGCEALKLVFLRLKGFPDRSVLCKNGETFYIEFKRKGKKLTDLQIKVRNMLETYGFEYHVCDEIGQAEEILDEVLSWHSS